MHLIHRGSSGRTPDPRLLCNFQPFTLCNFELDDMLYSVLEGFSRISLLWISPITEGAQQHEDWSAILERSCNKVQSALRPIDNRSKTCYDASNPTLAGNHDWLVIITLLWESTRQRSCSEPLDRLFGLTYTVCFVIWDSVYRGRTITKQAHKSHKKLRSALSWLAVRPYRYTGLQKSASALVVHHGPLNGSVSITNKHI